MAKQVISDLASVVRGLRGVAVAAKRAEIRRSGDGTTPGLEIDKALETMRRRGLAT